MVFVFLSLDDVVVVHSVIHFKTRQFAKWWKVFCKTQQAWMNVTYGSRRKVNQQFAHRKMWFYVANFEQNVLYGRISCMNFYLIAKYKTETLSRSKLFFNFKLQKHRRILLCCLRYKIRINDRIYGIVLLFLTLPSLPYFLFSFLLPLRRSVLLEIIASPIYTFFLIRIFFHNHSRITGLQ